MIETRFCCGLMCTSTIESDRVSEPGTQLRWSLPRMMNVVSGPVALTRTVLAALFDALFGLIWSITCCAARSTPHTTAADKPSTAHTV